MTYVITESCVDTKDRSCVQVCPVDCIQPSDGDQTAHLFIDPDGCIECGACVSECPVGAIFMDVDVPPAMQHWVAINADYFRGAQMGG